jgi:hypothetical protein
MMNPFDKVFKIASREALTPFYSLPFGAMIKMKGKL